MGIDVGTVIYLALAYYVAIALVLGLILFAAGTLFTRWILPRVKERTAALRDGYHGPEFGGREACSHQPGRA